MSASPGSGQDAAPATSPQTPVPAPADPPAASTASPSPPSATAPYPPSAPEAAPSPTPAAPPLLPRYSRPLTFAAVLDETFRIFRGAWVPFMLALAASSIANGLISGAFGIWFGRQAFSFSDAASNVEDFGDMGRLLGPLYGTGLVITILSYVLLLPAVAAVVVITDGAMRGQRVPVKDALRRGLRATPALLGASILTGLLGTLLFFLAIPLLLIGVFGILGGLIAGIGLLVWWGNPRARRPWLRWLIILAAPFGLPLYFTYRWTLFLPVIVVEHRGPWQALKRSANLIDRHWLRVFGIVTVISLLISMLQSIPGFITAAIFGGLTIVLAVSSAEDFSTVPDWFITLNSVFSAASTTTGLIIFGSLAPLSLTLLFVDLRNRREGTDIGERLAVLESAEPART